MKGDDTERERERQKEGLVFKYFIVLSPAKNYANDTFGYGNLD